MSQADVKRQAGISERCAVMRTCFRTRAATSISSVAPTREFPQLAPPRAWMVIPAGLEPATSSFGGSRSNPTELRDHAGAAS